MVEGVLVSVEHGVVVEGGGTVHLLGVPSQGDASFRLLLKEVGTGDLRLDDGLRVKDERWHPHKDFKLWSVILLDLQ